MNEQKLVSFAEQADRMMQKIALGVFLVAVAYTISAAKFFVSEDVAGVLDISSQVLGIIILIIVLPAFLRFMSMKRKNRETCREPEGFVTEIFDKATSKAFQFTFIFLIILEFVSGRYLVHLPGEFFIKLIIAVTLAIFSLTFFFLNRDWGGSEVEDEFGNGDNP
jgi:cobalamin synthase